MRNITVWCSQAKSKRMVREGGGGQLITSEHVSTACRPALSTGGEKAFQKTKRNGEILLSRQAAVEMAG